MGVSGQGVRGRDGRGERTDHLRARMELADSMGRSGHVEVDVHDLCRDPCVGLGAACWVPAAMAMAVEGRRGLVDRVRCRRRSGAVGGGAGGCCPSVPEVVVELDGR